MTEDYYEDNYRKSQDRSAMEKIEKEWEKSKKKYIKCYFCK